MSRRRGALQRGRGRASALAAIAIGAALAGCDRGAAVPVDAVDVRILAQDTSWDASYLVGAPRGARAEVPTAREVHVPLGAEVRLALASRDYICLYSAPALGLRDFAAPELPGEFRFRAARVGNYDLRG